MANSITDLIRIIDRHNFEKNNCTIVQLQAKDPLSIEFIREIQLDVGLETTKAGPFTWTKFETWEKAFEFYTKYHNYRHQGRPIIGYPYAHPRGTYEELMEFVEESARKCGFKLVSIPLVGPVKSEENQ